MIYILRFKTKLMEEKSNNAMPTTTSDTAVSGIKSLEQEREILLALSNDITKIRVKDDLLKLFTSRIKGIFYFTHCIITLIDKKREYYTPFLLDPGAFIITSHPDYKEATETNFILNEPFMGKVSDSDGPVVYILDEVLDIPGVPSFLKMNHDCGIREAMFTPLKNNNQTIAFLHTYSNRTGSFTNEFKNFMQRIAPQLSNAISNIIINEEINGREKVNEVLLSLTNDLATVHSRKDLIKVLNSGLRKLIKFTHSLITITDDAGQTYSAFLTDTESRPKEMSKYIDAINLPNSVEDGIYDVASHSYHAVVFDMKAQDLRNTPLWFRLNYAVGSREMMIKMLPNADITKFTLILFADQTKSFGDYELQIIEHISSSLSGVVRNISANEKILKKEQEKSLLLDFSQSIAAVKTKDELETAISDVLQSVLNIRLVVLRVIAEDGIGLIPYIWDKQMMQDKEGTFKELHTKEITIDTYLYAKVLNSKEPVIFDIKEEENNEKYQPNIRIWVNSGKKYAFGAPLRVGNKNIGLLWMLTDEINLTILKGICAQISIAVSNNISMEKLLSYKQRLEIENSHLHEQIKGLYNFSDIVGDGAAMQKVYHMMSVVSQSNTTVLILGETGTGKELIARSVHNSSNRKNKIMVKVNCAALPPHLIESELFGHEKGSFTGAYERRIGKFELAHEGTLFLDEIGELPLELQVKLLRVLQEREFERVGGKTTIKVDVRIIAATNRNLASEVNAGNFRSDLFYRLNVFPISLPPLRERPEDVEPLTKFFISRYSKRTGINVTSVSDKALQSLKSYSWPGNIRELEHLIERSILLSTGNILDDVHLPKNHQNKNINMIEHAPKLTMEDMERFHIIEILKSCQGKISGSGGAAEILDIPPSTLHSKMKKLNITRDQYFPN